MNPNNNKQYKILKFLSYKLREKKISSIKKREFVENSQALEIIGKEMFDNFFKFNKNIKITKFLDICGAPGEYSNLLLKKFPKSHGYGISLPVEENGVEFKLKNKNYTIIYSNIITNNISLNKKFNMTLASCVPYDSEKIDSFRFQMKLIVKSIIIMLNHIDDNGYFIVNLTFKDLFVIYNLIYILQLAFQSFELWKSTTVWKFTKSFYFFGYGFNKKKNIIDILENFLLLIKDRNTLVYSKFLGTKKDYDIITNKIEKIYLDLINNYNLLNNN
jgi:hypothetical protein